MTNLNEYDDSYNACETTAEIIPFRPARGNRHWSTWVKDCRPVKLKSIPASRGCMYSILSCLGQHADKNGLSWPAVSTIADVIGLSARQVRYGLRALEAQGFVQRIERKTRGGRKKSTNATNHYHLVDDPHAEIDQPTHDDLELFAPPPPCKGLHPPPAKGCTPPLQRVAAKESTEGLKEEKGEAKISADASDRRPESPGITFEVWEAYSTAYLDRYGVPPKRNAKVNGQLKQVVDRLGKDEAPQVAAFYVTHNDQWYVKRLHPVDSLLKDAEALRTQWATGSKVTSTAARQQDRTSTNMEAAKEAMRLRQLPEVPRLPAPRAETPDCLQDTSVSNSNAGPSETVAEIDSKLRDNLESRERMNPGTPGYAAMVKIGDGLLARRAAITPEPELRTGT